jgi:Fe-S-cluster-containing hydrogenase component 2
MHDAIEVDSKEGFAVVDEEKCEACGMCSELCPPQVIKINPKETKK